MDKRTMNALRVPGGADHGTEIHEGLVEGTCVAFRDEGFGEVPEKIFGSHFLPGLLKMAKSLERILLTFPSRMGASLLKAIERMAPAV